MKITFLVVLSLSLKACSSASVPTQVTCEKIDEIKCHPERKVCMMKETTAISSPGVTVSAPLNKDIKRVCLAYNKLIEYLPESLSDNFPDLIHIDAAACSIKQISKANFKNLSKLEQINMDGNLIERIESDTFESLTLLKEIYISYNRISFVGVNTFNGLANLQRLDLYSNQCINDDFKIPTEMKFEDVLKKIEENCSHE